MHLLPCFRIILAMALTLLPLQVQASYHPAANITTVHQFYAKYRQPHVKWDIVLVANTRLPKFCKDWEAKVSSDWAFTVKHFNRYWEQLLIAGDAALLERYPHIQKYLQEELKEGKRDNASSVHRMLKRIVGSSPIKKQSSSDLKLATILGGFIFGSASLSYALMQVMLWYKGMMGNTTATTTSSELTTKKSNLANVEPIAELTAMADSGWSKEAFQSSSPELLEIAVTTTLAPPTESDNDELLNNSSTEKVIISVVDENEANDSPWTWLCITIAAGLIVICVIGLILTRVCGKSTTASRGYKKTQEEESSSSSSA